MRKAIEQRLFNEDCVSGMARIPDGAVDMVLADPPYGATKNAWDVPLPMDRVWPELKRVCKPDAAMLFFAQCPYDKALGCSNLKELRYEWVWDKRHVSGFWNVNRMPLKVTENILVFYSRMPVYNPQMRAGKPYTQRHLRDKPSCYGPSGIDIPTCNTGDYFPINLLSFPSILGDHVTERIHPTQKPLELCRYLIRTYTDPGDTVLDICAGSGTAAVAAISEDRDWIAFETDEGYCAKAADRIESAMAKHSRSLFFKGFPDSPLERPCGSREPGQAEA